MNGFLPPVIFEIQANATQALASFSKVNSQLKGMEAQATKTNAALTRMQKTMVAVNAVAKVTALAFAGFATLGIIEITKLETAFAKLGQAMSNAGLSTPESRKSVSELAHSMEELGFGADRAAIAMSTLITGTGDLEKSNHLLKLSADLARTGFMSMEDAARLLVRAQSGNARLFTQFGITLDNTKPKALAVAEAMAKLEARLSGQAQAYTKTFAGQLAVLSLKIEDIAESIGAYLLPALNKTLSGFEALGKIVAANKAVLIAFATVLTTVVIVAVLNLTRKLALLTAAWIASNAPLLAIVASVTAVVAAFVWAWNKFETFRLAIVGVIQGFVSLFKIVGTGIQYIIKGLALIPDWAGGNQKMFQNAEKAVDGFVDKLDSAYKSLDSLSSKKINLNLKSVAIPDFGNGGGGTYGGDDLSTTMANAAQKIKEAAASIKESFAQIKASFSSVVNLDWKKSIADAMTNPTDKIVRDAQNAVNAYAKASSEYNLALQEQSRASAVLAATMKSGSKASQSAADSAFKTATAKVVELQKVMQGSLDDIAKFQQNAIDKIVEFEQEILNLEEQKTSARAKALSEQLQLYVDYQADITSINKENSLKVLEATQDVERRRAEILKASVDQLRNIFRSATQGSIGDLFKGLTFDGRYLAGGTANALASGLKTQFEKASLLAEDASALAGKGFSQTFIEQVVSQGPELGHQLASSILSASPDSIAELKKYWDLLEKVSQTGVNILSTTINDGMNLATQELRDQLTAVNEEYTQTIANLATELANSLSASKSKYDSAIASIKSALQAELAVIDTAITATKSRIDQLKDALIALQGLGAPGTAQLPVNLNPSAPSAPQTPATTPLQQAYEETKAGVERVNQIATNLMDKINSTVKVSDTPVSSSGSSDVAKALADYLQANAVLEQMTQNSSNPVNVTINAQTNASSTQIAQDVGWAIRTSADTSYSATNAAPAASSTSAKIRRMEAML